jgi:bacteriocin biosynthesis cyclodehydratase domain-containing protein
VDNRGRAIGGARILLGMVLRLDPSLPLLWRTPRSVQLGADRPAAVLDDVGAAEEQLLSALASGISPSGFTMLAETHGLSRPAADALLARLGPALHVALPATEPGVAVFGEGPLVRELAAQLSDAGDLQSRATHDGTPGVAPPDPALAVLVAPWTIGPSDHGVWLRRDVPHLPVIVTERAVEVGPFVVPGSTACLYCVQLARRDADPAWPALVAQLWGRPHPEHARAAVVEAAAFATRRIGEHRAGAAADGTVWRLEAATGRISLATAVRHPECSCAAPPESDWAPVVGRVAPRATTTARVDAVPA